MGQGDGKEGGRKQPPALAAALSGALSGAAISACVQVRLEWPPAAGAAPIGHHADAAAPAPTCSQPLDVLRTRMQADAALGTSK